MPISEILTSSPVSKYRETINAMLPIVNAATSFLSGTLVERPAASTEGRVFHVTSGSGHGMVQYDTGTAWVVLCDPAPDTKANRPSGGAVPAGARYYATDEAIEYVYDGSSWFAVGGVRAAARVSMSADVSLPNNAETTINYDTELYDSGLHDPSTNPNRVNLPYPGVWLVSGQAVLLTGADATDAYMRISSGSGGGGGYAQAPVKSGIYSVLRVSCLIKVGSPFGSTSYASMAAKQNSGSSATLSYNQRGGCFLEAVQISG